MKVLVKVYDKVKYEKKATFRNSLVDLFLKRI